MKNGFAFLSFLLLSSTYLLAQTAYVPNVADDNVSVIDLSTNSVLTTIPVGDAPIGVCVSPDGKKVYVSNRDSKNVSVIDVKTSTVEKTIPIGENLAGLTVSPDGKKLYVVQPKSGVTNDGRIHIVDLASNRITNSINTTGGWSTNIFGIAISPDESKVYVAGDNLTIYDIRNSSMLGSFNSGPRLDNLYFSYVAINTDKAKGYFTLQGRPRLFIFNPSTLNLSTESVDFSYGVEGVSLSPDGTKVYVTHREADKVSVINTNTNKLATTIDVGDAPGGISVSFDGTKVCVINKGSNNVSVIDAATNAVVATIAVGNSPDAIGNFISPSKTEIRAIDMLLAGDAQLRGEELILTPAENNDKSGAVWSSSEIDLSKDFQIKAEIYLGQKDELGADGIALVFQHKDNHLVGSGGYMGYKDVEPSLIIEFDTYQNNIAQPFNDPSDDHVGIRIDGNPKHNTNPKDYVEVGNLEDGNYHPITFTWHAATQMFDLTLDSKSIFKDKQFPEDILTKNNSKVYWGFTGSTGGFNNEQKVKINAFTSGSSTYGITMKEAPPQLEKLLKVTMTNGEVIYVHPTDNSTNVRWSDNEADITGLASITSRDAAQQDFNGKANTTAIVTQLGANSRQPYAAKICADLVAYGFHDWYLPAGGELVEIYKKLGSAVQGRSEQMTAEYYWSSSEHSGQFAWNLRIVYGDRGLDFNGKDYNYRGCRCVRR